MVTIGAKVFISPTMINAIVTVATTPIAYNGTLLGPRYEDQNHFKSIQLILCY